MELTKKQAQEVSDRFIYKIKRTLNRITEISKDDTLSIKNKSEIIASLENDIEKFEKLEAEIYTRYLK